MSDNTIAGISAIFSGAAFGCYTWHPNPLFVAAGVSMGLFALMFAIRQGPRHE